MFALGVTLTCLCTLEQIEKFYDKETVCFLPEFASANFRRMKKIGYSSDLIAILASMIESDSFRRVNLEQLSDAVSKRFTREPSSIFETGSKNTKVQTSFTPERKFFESRKLGFGVQILSSRSEMSGVNTNLKEEKNLAWEVGPENLETASLFAGKKYL